MRVTIKERTKGLCGTCKYAVLVRGTNNQTYMKCDQISFGAYGAEDRIPFEVKDCTSYRKVGSMDLHAMSGVAWILEVDRRRGIAGFVSNQDWNSDHPKDSVLPPGTEYD